MKFVQTLSKFTALLLLVLKYIWFKYAKRRTYRNTSILYEFMLKYNVGVQFIFLSVFLH